MQFSNTTNNNGIIQMIEYTTKLGLGSISGDTDLLNYFTALVNNWYYKVVSWIFDADNGWFFDDSNRTQFPVCYTNIVNNQRDYKLPDSLLKLKKVEVKDSDGNYHEIPRMEDGIKNVKLKNEMWQEDAGLPTGYYMLDNAIFLYPKPDTSVVTASAGLRLMIDRAFDVFTTSDTTQEPGFIDHFHPILYFGASEEWAGIHGKKEIEQYCYRKIFGSDKQLDNDIGLKGELYDYYSSRDENEKISINPGVIAHHNTEYE